MTNTPLKRTALDPLHRELSAKLVAFGGYEMPVHYPKGIIAEHRHTRTAAGLFDISHMGQLRITGKQAAARLERLVPADLIGLRPFRQRYALLTNRAGGILDDLIVTNAEDHLFVVVNAACQEQDAAHLRASLGDDCAVEALTDRALFALQGPEAERVIAPLAPAAAGLTFMTGAPITIGDADCLVTRSGYTGEDGFEISVPAAQAEWLARELLAHDAVEPVGLGARDSLRLEAGLCLYGHEIDATTTPVEAGLAWAISKERREGGARPGGFPGAEIILGQLRDGAPRRRVGLLPLGRAPVRERTELADADGDRVGEVTSGGYGPTLGRPVAMGYVTAAHAKPQTELQALVRGKSHPITVVGLPFVEHRYHKSRQKEFSNERHPIQQRS